MLKFKSCTERFKKKIFFDPFYLECNRSESITEIFLMFQLFISSEEGKTSGKLHQKASFIETALLA